MESRVTLDTGAAGHVTLDTLFQNAKLEYTDTPKKFVAANAGNPGHWSEDNAIQSK